MKSEENIYAVVATPSDYRGLSLQDLPQAVADGEKMQKALRDVLHIPEDNIRLVGESGHVTRQNFAHALAEYRGMVSEKNTLILYFSGHGLPDSLVLSDGAIGLAGILLFMEKLAVGRSVLILDCCYAGSLHPHNEAEQLLASEGFDEAVHKGVSILASSAADERSWADAGGGSIFTAMLISAMGSRHLVRKGCLGLTDIAEETRIFMDIYGKEHPERKQTLIFRTSVAADVHFQTEAYRPYVPRRVQLETNTCYVTGVRPLSTGSLSRLAVTVIPRRPYRSPEDVPALVHELLPLVGSAEVYHSRASELRHRGQEAAAVWFYFAYDDDDISMDRYYAVAAWAATPELRKRYYRANATTRIVDGICVSENASYELLRDMQKVTLSDREMADLIGKWERQFLSLSSRFQEAWQEAENRQLPYPELQKTLLAWAKEVQSLFYDISDAEIPPADLQPVYDKMARLTGWLWDISLMLGKTDTPDTRWMIRSFVRRYRQELDVYYPKQD